MSSESEILSYQPSLKTILAYPRLSVPLFQRPYSWGAPKKDFAARNYFLEFLANREANSVFGLVILYAATRYDFEHGTSIEAYIADGQHRLVTVVMGALAVQEALKRVAQDSHCEISKRAVDLLSRHHQLLATLTSSRIEVMLSPGAVPVRLTDFLNEQIHQLATLKLEKRQIEVAYRESLQEIRSTLEAGVCRDAKNTKKLDRHQELEGVGQKVKVMEGIYAWRSYLLLRDVLASPDDQGLYACLSLCEAFLDRIGGYCIPMACLVPRHNWGASVGLLESEAFQCFVNANGHRCQWRREIR